jgi:hypothetical protein
VVWDVESSGWDTEYPSGLFHDFPHSFHYNGRIWAKANKAKSSQFFQLPLYDKKSKSKDIPVTDLGAL